MKPRIIAALITLLTLSTTALLSFSASISYEKEADALFALGLFKGTNSGYELDREPTRAEAAAMLLKLLGVEEVAKKMNYAHPFKDVPSWANPFVGYMYEKGMTTGIGDQKFGSDLQIKSNEYGTFVLKALGYTSDDFDWKASLSFMTELGILNASETTGFESNTFKRNEMVHLSYAALKATIKDQSLTLAERLVDNAAISGKTAFDQHLVNPKYILPIVVRNSNGLLVIDFQFSKLDEEILSVTSGISHTGGWDQPLEQDVLLRRNFLTDYEISDRAKYPLDLSDFNDRSYFSDSFSNISFYSENGDLEYYAIVPKDMTPGSYNLSIHQVSASDQEILDHHKATFRNYLQTSLAKVNEIPSSALNVVPRTITTPNGSITKDFLSIDFSKLPAGARDFKYYTISGAWTDHFINSVTFNFISAYKVHYMDPPKTEYDGSNPLEINGGGFMGLELYDASGALVGYGVFDTDK